MTRTIASIALVLVIVVAVVQFLPRLPRPEPAVEKLPVAAGPAPELPVEPKPAPVTGEPAERRDMGRWLPVFVLDRRPNEFFVRYPGKSATFNEWLPADEVRLLAEDEDVRHKGWTADVRRGNAWRRSRILKQNGSLFFVHYEGESHNLDEWVPASQMRSPPM